ncbi:hypothetical protein D8B26_004743 [Coccidioides posadasii str. Silveira]|uniref:Uncharacterized protein n=3 Tax=Coccidioides posadasii TaxID=199306 RepID=E9D6R6_COCPS|nr:hypothetical protein CPC735_062740 [Coccidioides posadasii C735 delta SOWgp]EER28401.1 hypothetical protein CPC735_062740 [Coccidioides posadasii C735 delta SOWgp]EFW17938.1 conserved hypothetical protein [Coccidioides posadasii str. Silveira]KMM68624.1 hypothetical protein CPAG_04950 [Coccidioides posadasii RMSCC 3488]QVM10080.1 hypothetical protein D8B26_004743 [Coccidioides posadasii str. Silveira]|eukprot:XP_003070546.1 hypothetical protein CPC735_062740 [Coccidioides posadasii C735 delta SOWgp]
MSQDDRVSVDSTHPTKDMVIKHNSSSYLEPHVHPPPVHVPHRHVVPESLASTAKKWNTNSLGMRLALDAASATTAAALICPIVTIIDRAIIEKAAKGLAIRESLTSSLRGMITRPHHFIISTPFLLIYTLYSCTYLTANVIDTVVSTTNDKEFSHVSAGPTKFLSTALVNMSICVYKDSRFAKLFGAQGQQTQGSPQSSATASRGAQMACQSMKKMAAAPKIPKISLGLFGLRDSLTIFASFNVPQLISPHIPNFLASTPSSKTSLAQFTIPATVQIFSTPLHLLGLDLYNRQPSEGLPAADRWARVKRDWFPSCVARIGRILPAYGVGGVVNTKLRANLMHSVEATASEKSTL